MRRVAAFVLASLLCASPLAARADDASKRVKIDEMFGLLHLDSLMRQMTAAAQQQARANIDAMLPGSDPATRAKGDKFLARMFDLINQELSWQALEPEMARIYSNNFSEPQIDDILAFYRSPTGKAMLDKLPQLTTQSMEIAQQRMAALEPKMKALADEMTDGTSAAPPSTNTAPPPTDSKKSSGPAVKQKS